MLVSDRGEAVQSVVYAPNNCDGFTDNQKMFGIRYQQTQIREVSQSTENIN